MRVSDRRLLRTDGDAIASRWLVVRAGVPIVDWRARRILLDRPKARKLRVCTSQAKRAAHFHGRACWREQRFPHQGGDANASNGSGHFFRARDALDN